MKRMLGERNAIIDYIGLRGAMPVVDRETGEPGILRPGDEESRVRRVAWPEFFDAVEGRHYVLVCEDAPDLFYRFMNKRRAMRELGMRRRELARDDLAQRGLPALHARHAH
jgi:hypothetical protein